MSRLSTIKVCLNFLFLVLLLGLLNLGLAQTRKYKELSLKNCVRLVPQSGARGNILDREGRIIVGNKLSYDVMILPQGAEVEVNNALIKAAEILGENARNLSNIYLNGYLSPSVPVTVARNITIKEAIALEQERLQLPSIVIQPQPLRNYPFGNLAAHVIGYVSEIDYWRLNKLADYGYNPKDQVGFGGVEEKYDYYLRQEEGGLSVEVDHRGRFIRVLGFRQPHNGRDIRLTLNLKIQEIVEEALGGRKGCVVMMAPSTGEIIAMASSPAFDPASFIEQDNAEILSYFQDSDSPLINRAISGLYPAGSVFKIIVAAAGLETHKLKSSTTFSCHGSINLGKQKFNCWETHSEQNVVAALANSCNVFFYHSGLLIGAQLLHDYALKFGLSKTTSFELPYEEAGFIPSPLWRKINKFKNWYDGDTANMSIGQGDVLVTPLQMTRVMAVFANGGYLVNPYIVKAVGDKDISSYQRKIIKLPLRQDTLNYIRQGLRNTVAIPTGTGHILSALSVSVAGKTGTAQAPPGQPHAWFIGYFPFKVPQFVICVFLERGGPGYFSCVLAKQIIERMVEEDLL